jgi:hypothetical protein
MTKLQQYFTEGNLPENSTEVNTEEEVIQHLRTAYANLRNYQKKHHELRASYPLGLAEAIVLDQAPSLVFESMTDVKVERTEKQLKQLIQREKLQQMYKKIGNALQDKPHKGLSKIDIPDKRARDNQEFGDPVDPKTWKGSWISITNPQEIAAVVCEINAKQ